MTKSATLSSMVYTKYTTKESSMTLKLKILRIISFAMQEFDLDQGHLFVLILEAIEIEALKHERRLIEAPVKV